MRISSFVAGALCVIGLAACSDSSPNVVSADVSPAFGTYVLKSVDGQALPWVDTAHGNMTLISLSLTVNADGTWQDAVAYLDGTTGGDHGTIAMSGTNATVTQANGEMYTATISSGTMTLNFPGHVGVLQQF
jgi:hypothetical protein